MADSLSTITDAILDNRDYAASNSLTKAKLFESAVVGYLFAQPQQATDQGASLMMDMGSARQELARVRAWISSKSTTNASVRYMGFSSGTRRR